LLLTALFGTRGFAGVPVTPAVDQNALLASDDPRLAATKRLVYDFWRVILVGRHLERAREFMRDDYIQHNPNVPTGLQGFLDYFSRLGPPRDIPATIPDLVTLRAEGDLVTLAFVDRREGPTGEAYTTTWFDMFRIQDGKIAEHWDGDVVSAPQPAATKS
jgi:predicted SnoaL-like aldol condensation-catalyzing enzyme